MRNRIYGKSVVVVIAVAAFLLAAFSARAAASQVAAAGVCPEAHRCLDLLQDGIALIEAGRWETASVVLKEAAAGLEGRQSHERDLALAYVYLGVARLQVTDADETRQWFAEAQMRDPTLQLDPAEFPGDVLELWNEARDLGMLIVDSEPPGAEVSVDGVVRGRSPVGVAGLRPGDYRVALAHDGHSGVSRVLTVAAGRTERLFVPLVPSAGEVEAQRQGGNALTGIPDGVSTEGLSFGDGVVEQAPVNVFPIPNRFPAGTTKKSGRSWWRTLAGLLGVAGGAAMMIETAECRSGGGNLKRDRYGGLNDGILVETLGGVLGTSAPGLLRRCKLSYEWRLEFPDLNVGVRGEVHDHQLVKSGAYDPLADISTQEGIIPGIDFSRGGWGHSNELPPPGVAEWILLDPSFSERVNQALMESVGKGAGSRYRVPKEYLVAGGAMIAAGVLLSMLWSHVTVVDDLAVGVTPSGSVLASRSFGWSSYLRSASILPACGMRDPTNTAGQSVGPTVSRNSVSISGTTGSSSAGSSTNGASARGSVDNASVSISGTTGSSSVGSSTNSASPGGTVGGATVSGAIADATAGGAVGTTGASGTNAPYVQLLACQRL